MPQIKNWLDVEYLCFQGGGGKGFAYLGAVRALEELGILPIGARGARRIKGISGASAGAITSLLVTLGASWEDLSGLFADTARFKGFYDAPAGGFARGVTPQDTTRRQWVREVRPGTSNQRALERIAQLKSFVDTANRIDPFLLSAVLRMSPMLGGVLILLWSLLLRPWADRELSELKQEYPFLEPVIEHPLDYMENLLLDRGLYPGFAVRDFLRSSLRVLIGDRAKGRLSDAADVTFAELFDLTHVDLVITGTNLTQRSGCYFSKDTTPEFSVAEAVGISSCFPLVFKPVWVVAPKSDRAFGPLVGAWVDGGLTNNLPMRAFDRQHRTLRGGPAGQLNPRVLGLWLEPGAPQSFNLIPEDVLASEAALLQIALQLYETVLAPANLGQVREPMESEQLIPLFTFGLSLFDFGPSLAQSVSPLNYARYAVHRYFGGNVADLTPEQWKPRYAWLPKETA